MIFKFNQLKETEYFLFLLRRLPAIMFYGLRFMLGDGVISLNSEVLINT